ncbi:hypothetical protein D3C71_1451600 [compost metagenome]
MSQLRTKLALLNKKANPQQMQLINNIMTKVDEFQRQLEDIRDSVGDLSELTAQYGGEIERVVGGMIVGRMNEFIDDTFRGTEDFSFTKINETLCEEKDELMKWVQTEQK